MLLHLSTNDSDNQITQEIMENRQMPKETFDEFYAEVCQLVFQTQKYQR